MRSLIFSFLAVSCSDVTAIDTLGGRIETVESIDFGDVQVGIAATREISVSNTGEVTLEVIGVLPGNDFSTASHTFTVAPTAYSLAPGSSQVASVGFQAFEVMAEPSVSSFEIETSAKTENGDAVKATVTVSGRGVQSALRVEPNPLDFGTVLIGSSRTLDLTLTNDLAQAVELSGDADVTITAGNGRFEIIGSLGTLEAGASLLVPVRYTPDPNPTAEEDLGSWKVSNCPSPFCAVDVSMRARPSQAAFECSPASLDFGGVNPGTSVFRSVSCTNVASDPIDVIDWSLDPNSSTSYGVAPFAAIAVEPGASLTVEVSLTPTIQDLMAGVPITGELVIRGENGATGDGITPVRIPLTGRTGGPLIGVLPQAIDFGEIQIGTLDRRFLLVVNDGFDPLQITMIGSTAAEFEASAALTLEAGTSTSVAVYFAPTSLGLAMGELIIASNDASNPELRVPVAGVGIDLGPCVHSIVPSTLTFGTVIIGDTALREFDIENTGAGICLIEHLDITGAYFSLANGPEASATIGPGETKTVSVQFAPGGAGIHQGEVGFYISDPSSSLPDVPLIGVGLGITAIECPTSTVVDAGAPVTLAVNASSQTGTTATYSWVVTSAPPLGMGTPGLWNPDPPASPTEVFLPQLVGVYQIQASITDGLGITETCTTSVTAFGHGLRVELTWDGNGDVDLHLHNSNPTPWFGRDPNGVDDCFYANCNVSATPAGPIWDPLYPPYEGKNPALDVDNIIGFGPENIRVNDVDLGDSFTIALHYFWDHGYGPRVSTVNLYCGRVLVPTMTWVSNAMEGVDQGGCTENDFWKIATVTFTSTTSCTIAPLDIYQTGNDACVAF